VFFFSKEERKINLKGRIRFKPPRIRAPDTRDCFTIFFGGFYFQE
jgi:hypothetical protein